jgi:hypothetical protein
MVQMHFLARRVSKGHLASSGDGLSGASAAEVQS